MSQKYFKNVNLFNQTMNCNENLLNILSVNVRSISSITKFNIFRNQICILQTIPAIIAVQETWFDAKCLRLYSIPGFNAIHCCRNDNYGGTTIYVNQSLNYNILANCSEDYLDYITISIPNVRICNKPLVITSLYRSQKCAPQIFLRKIDDMLHKFDSSPCIYIGDFNIDVLQVSNVSRNLNDTFAEFNVLSCHKLITRPSSASCIDCVFSNISYMLEISSIQVDFTDHNFIFCSCNLDFQNMKVVAETKSHIDYDNFGHYLDDNLRIQNTDSSSKQCAQFIDILASAEQGNTICTTKIVDIRTKISPWMTERLISLVDYKDKLLRARRKNKSNKSVQERLKMISKVIDICNENLRTNYFEHNIHKCKGNLRKLWNFLNNQLGNGKSNSTDLLTEDGVIILSNEDKVSRLNDFFSNTVQTIKNNIPTYSGDDINVFRTLVPSQTTFSIKTTDKLSIERILEALDVNKTPGYDRITPKMLLTRKSIIADQLCQIFNKMILECEYPDVLKVHKICPIPKGKGSRDISNFRPISILSTIDKVFEKIIFEQLTLYLDETSILYERQFGFRKGTGTKEAVVNIIDHICDGIDSGYKGVAGVFFDLSKAFDLVDFDILMRKLNIIGFTQNASKLFTDYLHNRQQFVQIGENVSSFCPVLCGVPQGSVLGPLLFKIYINDMKNIPFKGKMYMFADDLCIFYNYNHPKVLQTQIEYDAAILCEFLRVNKLVLNGGKTKFVRFRPYISRNESCMSVHIDGNIIEESDTVKYLGVQLSRNLSWDKHISALKSKISSGIGILYKFKNKLNTRLKLMIYQSLIHSHLTYLPIIYGSKSTSSLKSLQSAQNKSLKLVFNLPLRFPTINLYREYVRNILPIRGLYQQQLLVHVFKSIQGIGPHTFTFNRNITSTFRLTRQAMHLQVRRCRLELTKQRIAYSGPNEYNQLPQELKNIEILSTFKLHLKQHLLDNLEILLTG